MIDVSLSDLSVLVVEDNENMRHLLTSMVSEFGVRSVETAHDGESGLSVLNSKPVDVILCDINMEPMDGLEFAKMVRWGSSGAEPTVPLILVTAHTDAERMAEAQAIGVNEFISKPVSAETLYGRLMSVLANPRSHFVADRIDDPVGAATDAPLTGDDLHVVERAEAVVAALVDAYIESAKRDIEAIGDACARALAHPAERDALTERISVLAHDVKGQGGSFGYPVMSDIGDSLAELCRTMGTLGEAELELVKAHVDAMTTVIGDRLEGDDDPRGAELVGELRDAVAARW